MILRIDWLMAKSQTKIKNTEKASSPLLVTRRRSMGASPQTSRSAAAAPWRDELLDRISDLVAHFDELMSSLAQNDCVRQSESADELRDRVQSSCSIAEELVAAARVILADYDVSLDHDELIQIRSRIRHDIVNKVAILHGTSQEVEFSAKPDSQLMQCAKRLHHSCDEVVLQLDLLVQTDSVPETVHPPNKNLPSPSVTAAHILVADDQVLIGNQLKNFLERQQHRVTLVTDGRQALTALRESNDINLVLLDVEMPGIQGTELLKLMKSDERFKYIPVIMVSGLADSERAIECIGRGAEDYLHKPVDWVLLSARVNSCLRRVDAERNKFRQFFSNELSSELACSDELLKTREAEVSILFCDIRRFSAISEKIGSAASIELINETLSNLSEIVFAHQGVLIDYIGDGLMAMWGAPKSCPNHADLSVSAALSMLDSMTSISSRWQDRLGESVRIGVGVNSGPVHVGVIGSAPKFKYGPLGPTVNLASRVEGVTKYLKSSLVVTEETKDQLDPSGLAIRRICRAQLANIGEPVNLYEIRKASSDIEAINEAYESALHSFESQRLKEAAQALGNVLMQWNDDVPAQLLMSRVLAAMVDESDFEPNWSFKK